MADSNVTYKAFVGKSVIRTAGARGLTSKAMTSRHVAFHGSCYYCGYESHSQMYCPLRWCHACKEYGHSEAVCSKLAAARDAAAGDSDGEWD